MRPVLSREQIRLFDRKWIERGVAASLLMENAGRGAAHLIGLKARPRPAHQAPRTSTPLAGSCIRCADERPLSGVSVVVLCGGGNNGGDGYVVARHLFSRGTKVRVFSLCAREKVVGEALTALEAMEAMGIKSEALPVDLELASVIDSAEIAVDALLGTGATRAPEGEYERAILALNRSETRVIALDIPSGLDADTGERWASCVQAFHTVCFAHLKRGLLSTEGHRNSGTVTVSHIGVPSALPFDEEPAAWLLEEADLASRLSPRSPVMHKGGAGRVVVVGGSLGTVGAARLSATAALRTGAGLVTIFSSEETCRAYEGEAAEVMTEAATLTSLKSETSFPAFQAADVLVVGPGLGQDEFSAMAIEKSLRLSDKPIVLDADALRWLGEQPASCLQDAGVADRVILTPHPGEASALLGVRTQEIERDRFSAVEELAKRFGCVVLLKGSRSIVCMPGGAPVVSAFGPPALATGGSGDVLSGMLGALLVGLKGQEALFEATWLAVGLQGLCAQIWVEENGDRGLLASEVAASIPRAVSRLLGQ